MRAGTEEKQAALAAMAARIRESTATGAGIVDEQLRTVELAGREVGLRETMAEIEYREDDTRAVSTVGHPDSAPPGMRPITDFLKPPAAANDTRAPQRTDRATMLDWPYAKTVAKPGPGYDPDIQQREVRILVTGNKWEGQGSFEEILDSAVARTEGAPVRIITGERGGVERMTANWARKNDVPIDIYPIDWEDGRAAGYRRNENVVTESNPHLVIAALRGPDRLSEHLIDTAQASGVAVESPITARVTQTPTGELTNLAALSRTVPETRARNDGEVPEAPAPSRPPQVALSAPLVLGQSHEHAR